ncbi:MAG TPA: tol-pal system protein YbgF [Candidatus Acidoferrales bacterium]|nr:tol-pal system protein YbgF [Candidatus Acidoferrales bacterium]
MRARTVVLFLAVLLAGSIGGAMLTPPSADAVSREIIQIQQTVNQILQNQQDLKTDIDTKTAQMQTLVQQSLDASNHLSQTMGALQKTLQDASANNGANNSSLTQQMQSVSDNMQDMQGRVGKLAQQMTDIQNTLQQISARVSSGAAPTQGPTTGTSPNTNPGTMPQATAPTGTPQTGDSPATQAPPSTNNQPTASNLSPISGDTLYSNAVRDLNSGNYTLSKNEFSDYLKNFPDGPFASSAQFQLGEVAYSQHNYAEAISAYDSVITDYPKSSEVAPAMLEKGRALVQTKKTTSAQHEFRELMRKFPGTDEAKKAEATLRQISPE